MDPLSKLPLECLQRILQIIADWDRKSTLVALLTTNKHIFAATCPYLYSDPFQSKLGHYQGPDHIHRQSFIRLLLGRIPTHILPMIVSLEFGFNTYPSSHAVVNPIIDYMAYIQHLDINLSDTNPRPIVYEEFPGQYRWLTGREGPLEPHYSAYNEIFGSNARAKLHKTILYYEVSWSVASTILEQLKSLTIPLIDVWRYLDSVHRLGQLECVRFNLDQTFDRNYNSNTVRDRADRAIKAMVVFVKEHKRLFGDQLKVVHVNDVGMLRGGSHMCPLEIQLEISKLVPPLKQPRS
ncbi:hypothetical protein BG015_012099 [Linnemannia schmuckeri]|uniref:Uncharacterized protein n=1 Tax=Linnemannia schmuckeri TaxID=64567 RepID=A0A9P5RV53_9FUNG|nr:hypothetical protein BG015_012099 [Linnemannia schmuckeri]